MGMTRVKVINREHALNLCGKNDVKKLKKMTDEEIHQAALSDPDVPCLTEYQLSRMQPFVFLKIKYRL